MGCKLCRKEISLKKAPISLVLGTHMTTTQNTNETNPDIENHDEDSRLCRYVNSHVFRPNQKKERGKRNPADYNLPIIVPSKCLPIQPLPMNFHTEPVSNEFLFEINEDSPEPIVLEEEKCKVSQVKLSRSPDQGFMVSKTQSIQKEMSSFSMKKLHGRTHSLRLERDQMKIDCSIFRGEHKGGLDKSYKLLEIIGAGSFGSVYKAKHLISNDIRAIKTVSKEALYKEIDPVLEFQILRMLDHPNIIKFYEYFQDHKNYYLVTEYCNGGELFEAIVKEKQFSEEKAACILQQLLSVVAYCHDHNIIHRDIKPENLLLYNAPGKNLRIKVIDFGGAKIFNKAKCAHIHESFGSPFYVSPEVIKQNYDEKSDIWSCGVIMYALLWGKPPFYDKTSMGTIQSIIKGKYSLQDPQGTLISFQAKRLISKMLAYNSKTRISASDALNDEWIKNSKSNISFTNENALLTFNNLQNFVASQQLYKAVLSFLTSQMLTKEDEGKLLEMFDSFDLNKDGQLSRDELITGYTMLFGDRQMAIIQIDRIMEEVDINKNGLIDYSEFILANTNINKLLGERQVRAAFNHFDLDGNGQITIEELKMVMGGGLESPDSEKYFQDLVEEVDLDGDGQINYLEFIHMINSFAGILTLSLTQDNG